MAHIGWFLANILHAIFLFFWSAFWMSAGAVAGMVGQQPFGLRLAHRAWSPGVFWAAGARIDVRGLDKIDWNKPYVFVCNHQSMIDIAALQLGLPTNLRFISKAELLNVPFMGAYIRHVGMIAIDRGNSAASIAKLEAAAREVANGTSSVIAFAEGTRSRTGVIQPFKKGAFMLALSAQVPVVPISIEGARNVLPPDGFNVRPGVIRLDIGDPIPTVGMTAADRDRLIEQAHAVVVAMNVAAGGLGEGSVAIEFGGAKRAGVVATVSRP